LPDTKPENTEIYQKVLNAIDSLPEIYQTPLMLHLMEEMDAKEIASRLNMASETIRKQIYRGIQLLREKLQPLMYTD
jgi:RNA polymerase sigma factor (sigma-70 family)